jgi:hypothetical protein
MSHSNTSCAKYSTGDIDIYRRKGRKNMKKEVKISGLSLELYRADEAMLCEYINTGMFNDVIQGYVKLAERVAAEVNDAAEEFNIKQRMSAAALMPSIFENYTAQDALEELRG